MARYLSARLYLYIVARWFSTCIQRRSVQHHDDDDVDVKQLRQLPALAAQVGQVSQQCDLRTVPYQQQLHARTHRQNVSTTWGCFRLFSLNLIVPNTVHYAAWTPNSRRQKGHWLRWIGGRGTPRCCLSASVHFSHIPVAPVQLCTHF